MATRAFVGKGTVYLQDRSAAANPLYPIGNCSKVSNSVETDVKELPDYENAGGGTAAKLSRIKSVKTVVEMTSWSPENIALAVRGAVSANASVTAIVGEARNAIALGSLIPLNRLGNLSVAPVVKKGATVIAAAGNWEWRRGGLYILPGAAGLVAGDNITVDYTPVADNLIQAMVSSGLEYRMVIDILNEADSGKAMLVTQHRVSFDPTSGLDWIADDFGKLTLNGTLLADSTITGAGISQYFTAREQQ